MNFSHSVSHKLVGKNSLKNLTQIQITLPQVQLVRSDLQFVEVSGNAAPREE